MNTPARQRVARAISWSVIGTGSAQAILLVASVITARMLGEVQFGRLGLIQFTLNMLYSLIAPSLGWTVMRTVASLRSVEPERLRTHLSALFAVGYSLCLVLAGGLALSARWVAISLFDDVQSHVPLLLASVTVLFGGIYAIITSGLSGFEAFRLVAFLNTLRGTLIGVAFVGGAYWGGLEGVVMGIGIGTFISAFVAHQFLRKILRNQAVSMGRPDWRLGLRLSREFSLPAFLSTLIASMMPWWGSILLARQASSLSEVAVLSVSNYWRTILMFLPSQIAQSTSPILTHLWGQGDHTQMKRLVLTNLKMVSVSVLIPILPMLLFSAWILNLYDLAVPRQELAFRLLMVSAVFASLCAPLGYTLLAMGRFWAGFAVNLVWAVLFLVCAWSTVVLMQTGSVGLGWAYLLSYATLFAIASLVTFQILKQTQRTE